LLGPGAHVPCISPLATCGFFGFLAFLAFLAFRLSKIKDYWLADE